MLEAADITSGTRGGHSSRANGAMALSTVLRRPLTMCMCVRPPDCGSPVASSSATCLAPVALPLLISLQPGEQNQSINQRGDGATLLLRCSPTGAKARAQFATHKGGLAKGKAPFSGSEQAAGYCHCFPGPVGCLLLYCCCLAWFVVCNCCSRPSSSSLTYLTFRTSR